MKTILFICFSLLIATHCIAQKAYTYQFLNKDWEEERRTNKKEYPAFYKISTCYKKIPSTYTIEKIDDNENSKDSLLHIVVMEKKEGVPFLNIYVKNESVDMNGRTDIDGRCGLKIIPGNYQINLSYAGCTPITISDFKIEPHIKYIINITLGCTGKGSIMHIQSKRNLSTDELDKLVDDITNDKGEENELILYKICYYGFEI